jgi:hypothetical protein
MNKTEKLNKFIEKENLENLINSTICVRKLKYKTIKLLIIKRNKKDITIIVYEIKSYRNKYYKNIIEKSKIRYNNSKYITKKFDNNIDILSNSKLDYIFKNILDYLNYEL